MLGKGHAMESCDGGEKWDSWTPGKMDKEREEPLEEHLEVIG